MAWPGQGYLELPVFYALDIHCRPDRACSTRFSGEIILKTKSFILTERT